ncbi:endonuclease III [Hydrogenivirga sp. 128-5-R1-1]|uniref:endonuclease III domain-containing protein n=1 Tax=Hydrogenivirga sp. 128-5-R1-1 TaxID=392423 RepID=UPI00015EF8EB|nr:endonuclease III [Hydrogenivirga sp. 128-5-R1-1]EDP73363.1 endonuclease III [Hydrogenivirga sp. 128-5-R1-1]
MQTQEFIKVLEILEKEFPKWKAPVVSLMAQQIKDPFKVLISTIISLRTKDEVTAKASKRLFSVAKTPEEISKLSEEKIAELIYPAGFYKNKAKTIKDISKIILEKYNGKVPDTLEKLLKFKGVGRKTANLVLSEGFNKPAICVDIHVHRISNRLGFVKTKTPEKTEFALMEKLPEKYWNKINKLLVGFGQTICKPVSPYCSKCPVENLCKKKNIKTFR